MSLKQKIENRGKTIGEYVFIKKSRMETLREELLSESSSVKPQFRLSYRKWVKDTFNELLTHQSSMISTEDVLAFLEGGKEHE